MKSGEFRRDHNQVWGHTDRGEQACLKNHPPPGGDRPWDVSPVNVGDDQTNVIQTAKTYSAARDGVVKRAAAKFMDETAPRAGLDVNLGAVDGENRLGLTLIDHSGTA